CLARAAGAGGLSLTEEGDEAEGHGLLRNRAFMALWGAQILSQTAANAVTSALIILVAELTHSNTSSSILILLAIVPAVLFGFAGGVVVDRSDRHLVLVFTNAARAAAMVPLVLAGESVTTAYLVNFLVATVTLFFVPAEAATIPAIVRKRDLTRHRRRVPLPPHDATRHLGHGVHRAHLHAGGDRRRARAGLRARGAARR